VHPQEQTIAEPVRWEARNSCKYQLSRRRREGSLATTPTEVKPLHQQTYLGDGVRYTKNHEQTNGFVHICTSMPKHKAS
jgi:hypothetical protein